MPTKAENLLSELRAIERRSNESRESAELMGARLREEIDAFRGDINEKDKGSDEKTILHTAASNGWVKIVEALIADERVDPNLFDGQGRTPLHRAEGPRSEAVVAALLASSKVDPNKLDIDGQTPLRNAAMYGSPEVIRALLADPRVDPNLIDSVRYTPLQIAIVYGCTEVAQALLSDKRVEVNEDSEYGHNLLAAATDFTLNKARDGAIEPYERGLKVVKALLARGVSPDLPEDSGLKLRLQKDVKSRSLAAITISQLLDKESAKKSNPASAVTPSLLACVDLDHDPSRPELANNAAGSSFVLPSQLPSTATAAATRGVVRGPYVGGESSLAKGVSKSAPLDLVTGSAGAATSSDKKVVRAIPSSAASEAGAATLRPLPAKSQT